jgi:predicted nucleic acid-binding protein
MGILLDSCVLIDILRGEQRALNAVVAMREPPCYCDVSVTEIYAGLKSQVEEQTFERMVRDFRRVLHTPDVFRRAGTLLRNYQPSHGTDFPDALVAATAEHHGLALATLNIKHFPMFKKLRAPY